MGREKHTPMARSASVCLRICLISNTLLAIVKFIAGILGNSQALIADGINSVVDVVSSGVAWIGHRISLNPPDKDHPYGHGNADVLAALFVGLVIFFTGIFVGGQAWVTIRDGDLPRPTLLPVLVAIGVIISKWILYLYTTRVGNKTHSPAVQATAADHKSDIIATSGALAGVFGAWVGVPILDPLAALWVAALIVYNAIRILTGNVHILMAGQPDPAVTEPVVETIRGVQGVEGFDRVRARQLGSKVILDIEILVDKGLTVDAGHEIARKARTVALRDHPTILDVVVHVEPYPTNSVGNRAKE